MTVATIAELFVQPHTKAYIQSILDDSSSVAYLAKVATWADSYRYTEAGKFSAPYHFIDAIDSPPKTCGVTFSRDCPEEGCVIDAIRNYVSSCCGGWNG